MWDLIVKVSRSTTTVHCITTRESLIGHSRWALPHYTEMGHSSTCSSFWGTAAASPGRGSYRRPPVPMALNIPEGHRGVGCTTSVSEILQNDHILFTQICARTRKFSLDLTQGATYIPLWQHTVLPEYDNCMGNFNIPIICRSYMTHR